MSCTAVYTGINTPVDERDTVIAFSWPPYGIGQAIIFFALWFLSFILLFFPRLISAAADWMSTILPHMVWFGLSANLECRSEMCCMRLAENAGHKNRPKIRHLGAVAQFCGAISSQLRHASTVGKNLLNSNISPHVLTIW